VDRHHHSPRRSSVYRAKWTRHVFRRRRSGSASSSGACTETMWALSGWVLIRRVALETRFATTLYGAWVRVGDLIASDEGHYCVSIRGKGLAASLARRSSRIRFARRRSRRRCCKTRTSIRTSCSATVTAASGWHRAPRAGPCSTRAGGHLAKSDGLSGDIICSLFEDREGSIWVATSAGSTASGSSRSGVIRRSRACPAMPSSPSSPPRTGACGSPQWTG
jgi:hypothetical protein